MVKAVFYKKNDEFCGFKVEGHAEFDEKGRDIVCSGISAVVEGGMNAIKDITSFKVAVNSETNLIECISIDQIRNHDAIVIETIRIQLESIKRSYPKYLTIKEERME